MNRAVLMVAGMLIAATAVAAFAQDDSSGKSDSGKQNTAGQPSTPEYFKPTSATSTGTVDAGGTTVNYDAVAGTIVVHPAGWSDVKDTTNKDNPTAEASMFYVAYFKHGAQPGTRPVTFIYNGGPGSATVWLHMGAWGPKRVVTNDDTHTPAAPYQLVNNEDSLLDVSDLVFIDAPGAGFSRIAGKDAAKKFYGVDQDVHAFAEFIHTFLSQYNRWNSPKYLFGESYGTPRSAALIYVLEHQYDTDFNGVILLSQILNYDFSPGRPESNPGVELPYALALPTYTATAWYHHKLPGSPKNLDALIQTSERFAMGPYLSALQAGASLPPNRRNAIAQQLHMLTGLPVAYLLKANLRVNGGEFENQLLGDADDSTGRLDTRFSGPSLDPLNERAEYDPQSAALGSAYISAFNDYARTQLHYGNGMSYKPSADSIRGWDFKHKQPNSNFPSRGALNVMPDLAAAMKLDPNLKVLLNGGYFDLATPFYQGWYEMHHLPMQASLQKNIQYRYYRSGHMVYVHVPALKEMHDNVAAFIRQTENQGSNH